MIHLILMTRHRAQLKRDTTATSNGEVDAIPAADRAFTGPPDWGSEDWDQLVAPLATVWAERTGKNLRIDGYCRDAALAWPKAYVRRAIGALIDDLNSGRNIKNPGGLLAISAQEGRLHYFPTTPPQPAADPELERSRFLSDSRTRALDRHGARQRHHRVSQRRCRAGHRARAKPTPKPWPRWSTPSTQKPPTAKSSTNRSCP